MSELESSYTGIGILIKRHHAHVTLKSMEILTLKIHKILNCVIFLVQRVE